MNTRTSRACNDFLAPEGVGRYLHQRLVEHEAPRAQDHARRLHPRRPVRPDRRAQRLVARAELHHRAVVPDRVDAVRLVPLAQVAAVMPVLRIEPEAALPVVPRPVPPDAPDLAERLRELAMSRTRLCVCTPGGAVSGRLRHVGTDVLVVTDPDFYELCREDDELEVSLAGEVLHGALWQAGLPRHTPVHLAAAAV